MAGRSLWSVLMVAWLSATNLPTSTETSPSSEVALSDRWEAATPFDWRAVSRMTPQSRPPERQRKRNASTERFGTAVTSRC